jgi:hypothetical protein
MGLGRYILVGHQAVEEPDLMRWAKWFEGNDRMVKNDRVGPYTVSTVFLAIDHSYGIGRPLLFETMIFKGNWVDVFCTRYSTWDEAVSGHLHAIETAKALVAEGDI